MSRRHVRLPLFVGRPPLKATAAATAALLLAAAAPASASTFGSLSNFDAVNDTGHEAYGFEIEFEDAHFYRSGVGSVFGLNRDFGLPGGPSAVVRFGTAKVEDYNDALGNHAGVRITYGASFDALADRWVFDRTKFTPTNSMGYNTSGESCWPGANKNWTVNPCDHYGVTTTGSPAKTTYNWLVESTPGSGVMSRQVAGLPPVAFAYQPSPGPAAPAVVQARIQAVAEPVEPPEGAEVLPPERLWGQAFWVKTYTTKVKHYIDLGNLLRGDQDMEAAEVESEWSILQNAPLVRDREAEGPGANEVKEVELDLDVDQGDKAIMRRYEFYKYTGPFNDDGSGEVMCDGADPLAFGHACDTPFGDGQVADINDLGHFVGAQMAGFNVDQAAAVPEPQTAALMLAGLVGIGSLARRRSRQR